MAETNANSRVSCTNGNEIREKSYISTTSKGTVNAFGYPEKESVDIRHKLFLEKNEGMSPFVFFIARKHVL